MLGAKKAGSVQVGLGKACGWVELPLVIKVLRSRVAYALPGVHTLGNLLISSFNSVMQWVCVEGAF